MHDAHDLLIKTLITPLDQEDTRALSQAIDDVVDSIEEIGSLLLLYKVEQPTEEARQLGALIVACAEHIQAAMPLLRDKKTFPDLRQHIQELNRLEREADIVGRAALENLIATSRNDWFEFMRWKELYELLEQTVNQCEDIADVFQTVVVKNG